MCHLFLFLGTTLVLFLILLVSLNQKIQEQGFFFLFFFIYGGGFTLLFGFINPKFFCSFTFFWILLYFIVLGGCSFGLVFLGPIKSDLVIKALAQSFTRNNYKCQEFVFSFYFFFLLSGFPWEYFSSLVILLLVLLVFHLLFRFLVLLPKPLWFFIIPYFLLCSFVILGNSSIVFFLALFFFFLLVFFLKKKIIPILFKIVFFQNAARDRDIQQEHLIAEFPLFNFLNLSLFLQSLLLLVFPFLEAVNFFSYCGLNFLILTQVLVLLFKGCLSLVLVVRVFIALFCNTSPEVKGLVAGFLLCLYFSNSTFHFHNNVSRTINGVLIKTVTGSFNKVPTIENIPLAALPLFNPKEVLREQGYTCRSAEELQVVREIYSRTGFFPPTRAGVINGESYTCIASAADSKHLETNYKTYYAEWVNSKNGWFVGSPTKAMTWDQFWIYIGQSESGSTTISGKLEEDLTCLKTIRAQASGNGLEPKLYFSKSGGNYPFSESRLTQKIATAEKQLAILEIARIKKTTSSKSWIVTALGLGPKK